MSAQYIPAYKDPRFRQSLPGGAGSADDLERLPHTWGGAILYRDPDSGAEYLVPNVWYNQTRDQRVKAYRFYAERARESAGRWRSDPSPYAPQQERQLLEDALRLDGLADLIQAGTTFA